MSARTYSFRDVSFILGGVPLSGFADGDAIRIEFPESATDQVGAGGAHTRSLSSDRSATVTIRLQQTSPSNLVLEGAARLDRLAGAGALPLLIRDNLGTELFSTPQAWVSQPAAKTFGMESGAREWQLRCAAVEAL